MMVPGSGQIRSLLTGGLLIFDEAFHLSLVDIPLAADLLGFPQNAIPAPASDHVFRAFDAMLAKDQSRRADGDPCDFLRVLQRLAPSLPLPITNSTSRNYLDFRQKLQDLDLR